MQQYICDRCGAVIPSNKWFHNRILFYNSDVSYDKGIEFQGNRSYSECDLCDDCLELLNKINESFMSCDRTNEEILGAIVNNDRY